MVIIHSFNFHRPTQISKSIKSHHQNSLMTIKKKYEMKEDADIFLQI